MSTVRFVRRARREAPRTPSGEVSVQPPPDIPRATPGNLVTRLLPLVMVAAMIGMVALMFTTGAARSPMAMIFPLMMVVSLVGMLANGGRSGGTKTAEANEDRKDYLRYLDQLRREVTETAHEQRRALEWSHPDPALLWTLAGTVRMWERRSADPDFGHLRVGRGGQRLATRLVPPDTGPVEDLEPVAAVSLRRFVRAHSVVQALPTAVSLRGFAAIGIEGDRGAARSLARAMLAQACTFHGPDTLQVAVVCGPDTAAEWEWIKWLPHAQNPVLRDGAGSARTVFGSLFELETDLAAVLAGRSRFVRNAPATEGAVHLVVAVDGGVTGSGSGVLDDGLDAVTVLDLSGYATRLSATRGLRLVVEDGRVGVATGTDVDIFADADGIGTPQAQTLARLLAPYRVTNGAVDESAGDDRPSSWQELLGLGDVARFDPAQAWVPRRGRDRLRVPIGVGIDGAPVELDLKEAAENGMGPHGLCIGATGSGKSEFLRTLVLGLVATHPPEALNLVLVDFKGGATFLGLDRISHVAAVITNLADEIAMVDRMKDALEGEMNRRQELLRTAGNFANVGDYEKARAAGAPLDPLPALFIVVDEFSELLSQQPEFADLFAAIGRLGRSLHMHLLLASQRLDEGRLRGLDSHLSYRIGLKTFSANESRSVLGVPDAYHLPSTPGAGYLRTDSADIQRFSAAYVSGPYEPGRPTRRTRSAVPAGTSRPRLFTARAVPVDAGPPAPVTEPLPVLPAGDGRSVLEVVVDRIRGHGTPAHEVWLPPLDDSPSLDMLLPRSVLTGDVPRHATLRTVVGVVDRPFEQRRDPLVVDLSGSAGNVVVVGGPQSGKSTLLRSLVLSMALTHTAEQVQFYGLDFGGGTLSGLAGLPHVGSVAGRHDTDRVRRTVAEMMSLLRRRERSFAENGIESMAQLRRMRADAVAPVTDDPFGDVFLVVDGWPSIRQDFEALEQTIGILAAQGLSYGIHVVLSAPRWGDVRPAMRDLLGTRLELRLGDPSDSEYGRKRAAMVPEGRPGRGIDRDGLHILGALPRVDGSSDPADLAVGVAAAVEGVRAATPGRSAPPVRMLPERIDRPDLLAALPAGWPPPADASPAARLSVPIGIDESELAPVSVDFTDHPHLLIFGDSECGKTNLLRGLCRGLVEAGSGAQTRIIVGDYRRTLLGVVGGDHLGGYAPSATVLAAMVRELAGIFERRLPGPDTTQQQLRDRSWWTGPEVFVVIDDYDMVVTSGQNPLLPLLDYLPQGRDIGLHLVVARRSGGAGRAMYEPILGRLRELSTPGLIMSGSRDEGALVGAVRPSPVPPGRGTLVRRDGTALVQTAWAPEA